MVITVKTWKNITGFMPISVIRERLPARPGMDSIAITSNVPSQILSLT
jgi:hypothetical protein